MSLSSPKKKKCVGQYELGKTLGKGTYSTVKKAVNICTHAEVAVKILKGDLEDIDREIAILRLLKHPNIVDLLDVVHDEATGRTYLIFELVNGGDLFDYTIARGRLTEREARRIMRELVGAIAYCHANMVVHRDLKLENILMDKDGHARIADFGLSSIMKPGLRMTTYCGSPMYMSPEIIQGLGYGPGVDIWSLGVVLYTVVVGMTPWKLSQAKMVEDLDAVLAGQFSYPDHLKPSPELEDLLNKMLVPNQAKRASIEELMRHPWLTEGNDPISVPMAVSPGVEVNERILRQMVAMGYPHDSTYKAITEKTPCPALMVYQHMLAQMEEENQNYIYQLRPRKAHARRLSVGDHHTYSLSISEQAPITPAERKFRRSSCNLHSLLVNEMPLMVQLPASPRAAPASPHAASPRSRITPTQRTKMRPISEDAVVEMATENGGNESPTNLPDLHIQPRLADPHGSSAPSSPHSPVSPTTPVSPYTSDIPVVRGAFNVATTTLKPRGALLAEISRALTENGVEYVQQRTTFECSWRRGGQGGPRTRPLNASTDSSDGEGGGGEGRREDGITFQVEVCRVSGLEMLLAVRFQRVVGNAFEYQEVCNLVKASMKL